MGRKKESYFWTSYSDLMTSLFFVMLILFVLVILLLHKKMEATERQLNEIKKIALSTQDLDKSPYFNYRKDYKKYVLNIQVQYPQRKFNINDLEGPDKDSQLKQLREAGNEIKNFLNKHSENQYILIVEGQASKDNYPQNYELSYQRALGLIRYWMVDSGIDFGKNCEILISGSGDGKLETGSMRETNQRANQRFLIHIIPKNIFENDV